MGEKYHDNPLLPLNSGRMNEVASTRARIFLFFIKLLRNLEWVISCLAMQMQKKRRSKKWSALSRQWQKLVSALSPLPVLAITSLLRQFFGHIDRIFIIRKFCSPKDSLVSFYKN